MRLYPQRLRTLMIAVALLALLMTPMCFLFRVSSQLSAFYGRGGVLARQARAFDEAGAGDEARLRGQYVDAEAQYRSALNLMGSLPEPDSGTDTSHCPSRARGRSG